MRALKLRRASLLVVGSVICSGCNDDAPSDATTPETTALDVTIATTSVTTTSGPATATTSGQATSAAPVTSAPPVSTSAPAPAVGEPVVASEVVATLERPIGLGVRPDDDALYVLEQAGRVVRVDVASGGEPVVVADLTDRVVAGGERGLLGIAFAADGGRVWLHYSGHDNRHVIAEYPVAADGTIDVDSERVLLSFDDPRRNHNGGDLMLGADGMLYIAIGDGGGANDPERRASDPMSLFGKLLRIDPDPSGSAPYGIPPDNPFAAGPLNGVQGAPEVWAWGLRNPWKFSVDPVTGELWIADVGQRRFEEIDVVAPSEDHPAGWAVNFGWSAYEGTERFNTDVPDPGNLVFPAHVYDHSQGCAISGGEVYRGSAIAGLEPAYVYSDYCSGTLWALDVAAGRNLTIGAFDNVTAVRAGPDRELYVLEAGGDVHRLIPG